MPFYFCTAQGDSRLPACSFAALLSKLPILKVYPRLPHPTTVFLHEYLTEAEKNFYPKLKISSQDRRRKSNRGTMNTVEDDSSLCPVCKEHFTDGSKAPACLKCGHVLCRQCAYIIMSNTDASCRICPICRGASTFDDVRVVYIGNIRPVSESSTLESENEHLRQRLRSKEKEYESNLRTLRWYQKEHLEKCDQRSKMLSYYENSHRSLYGKMRYYRDNWYRLRNNFEKLRIQRNRINSELTYFKNRYKFLNHRRSSHVHSRRQSHQAWSVTT